MNKFRCASNFLLHPFYVFLWAFDECFHRGIISHRIVFVPVRDGSIIKVMDDCNGDDSGYGDGHGDGDGDGDGDGSRPYAPVSDYA